jgi:outer membrane lipoprotein-sorting protein
MNDSEKYLREFVKNIPFDDPDKAHRDALKTQLLNAFPRHRLQPAARPAGVWRTIMNNRRPKLAAAAAIVFATILSMYFFNKTSGIVWANVAQRLEDIKTVAYKITADITGMPGTPEGYVTHTEQTVRLSYEQGAVRIDSSLQTPRGPRNTHTYIAFEESVAVTVIPNQKKYMEVEIGPEQMEKMGEEKGDPVTLLKAMLEHDYTELGRQTIDGVAAWGIEVSDPKLGPKMGGLISGGMFDEITIQLWVDEANELPIKITATGSSANGKTSMTLAMGHFQWEVDIEPAVFKPEIPDDYELLAQAQWEKGHEGEEIIEVLRLFVEFAEGKYPSSLNTMTVAQAIAPALKEKFPPGSAKPSQALIARLMKVDRVGMMYTTLEKDGKDPAYYGDKVSTETPKAVLFRWKIDNATYRVVFGDLSTRDVTPGELADLETSP